MPHKKSPWICSPFHSNNKLKFKLSKTTGESEAVTYCFSPCCIDKSSKTFVLYFGHRDWNMENLYKVEATGNVKPVLLMIAVQTLYAVVNIMLKIVADDGMSLSVLVAYRFFFASAFIVPLALIFERCFSLYISFPLKS